MLSLNLNELEVEKVNTLPEFRQFITEEQDKEFILNTVRHEGEKRGEKRGEARGEKKGILKSKLETARNMLKDKVNINTISKYTGLTLSQIKNITL